MPRQHRVHVERRFSDLDVLGHVNNVVYAVYLEEARVRLLTELGRRGVTVPPMVVARQEIDYARPLTLKPEPVEVVTWVESVGGSSYVVAYEIRDDDGTVAARARTVVVCFDPATGRSAAIPDDLRSALSDNVMQESS